MCTFCHGSRFPLFRYGISDFEGIERSHKRKTFTLFKQCSIHKINNTPFLVHQVGISLPFLGPWWTTTHENWTHFGHQTPSLTRKGVTTRRNVELPLRVTSHQKPTLMSMFLLLRAILSALTLLSAGTPGILQLSMHGEQLKIGLRGLPRWIARLCESPLKPKTLCFEIFVCIIKNFSKANHNYLWLILADIKASGVFFFLSNPIHIQRTNKIWGWITLSQLSSSTKCSSTITFQYKYGFSLKMRHIFPNLMLFWTFPCITLVKNS